MITPQKSYLPLGSLKGALLYPNPTLRSDDPVEAALDKVDLGALSRVLTRWRAGTRCFPTASASAWPWPACSSISPRVVILDDALSALDEGTQVSLLARLRASCPTPPSSASVSGRRRPACTIASSSWSASADSTMLCDPPARDHGCGPSNRFLQRTARGEWTMTKLNYWNATWSLDEAQCPCDLHFLDYLAEKRRQQCRRSSISAPAITTSSG